ncbi:SGNH/GDSL hydrolase family protein [Paenarthrobacter nicotinovorans]|uniref:SGNH/GDSL hydrolase family protein n=1 Tax=Paenarthrobacter nicotinovorans TaxID=29320 RepID=UPI003A8134E1
MTRRLVSVDDSFNIPDNLKVRDVNLPDRLQPTALNATYGPSATPMLTAFAPITGSVAYAPAFARPLGGKAAFAGDSITACDSTSVEEGNSWASILVGLSQGRLSFLKNAAVPGRRSIDVLNGFDAEVIAANPETVGVLVGTNDAGNAVPLADTQTNIKAIVAKLRAAGIAFFLCTIPPRNAPAKALSDAPVATQSGTGGTLVAATYSYTVVSVSEHGKSLPSPAASVVVAAGTTNSVTITAPFIHGSKSYEFYRDNQIIGTNTGVYNANRVFTDTGQAGGAAAPVTNTWASAYSQTIVDATKKINGWLRVYCSKERIPLVDMHSILVDPATGTYKVDHSMGGLHPTPLGQVRMGQGAWDALKQYMLPVSGLGPAQDQANVLNAYSNGLFQSGTLGASNAFPTGASYSGFGTTPAVQAKAGFLGNAWSLERTPTSGTGTFALPAITTGWTAGDRIRFSCVLSTENMETSTGGAEVYVRVKTNGNGGPTQGLRRISAMDAPPEWWTFEFTIPTGTTSLQLDGQAYRGGGKVSLGQVSFYNLTTNSFLVP